MLDLWSRRPQKEPCPCPSVTPKSSAARCSIWWSVRQVLKSMNSASAVSSHVNGPARLPRKTHHVAISRAYALREDKSCNVNSGQNSNALLVDLLTVDAVGKPLQMHGAVPQDGKHRLRDGKVLIEECALPTTRTGLREVHLVRAGRPEGHLVDVDLLGGTGYFTTPRRREDRSPTAPAIR